MWSRIVERSIYPIIIGSQTIPIITLAPLLIIWVGTDIMSKVIVERSGRVESETP